MRTGLRVGVVAALAGGVLLTPAAADAKRFTIKAPQPGQVVIAQIRGTSTGNKPPRLKLTNSAALRGTAIASSTWKAKGGGAAYDGVVVLLRRAGQGGSARMPSGAPAPAAFEGTLLQRLILTVSIHNTLLMLQPTAVSKVREAAERSQCKNNLRTLGPLLHQYHGSTHPSTPPRIFIRQVCGAILDQTVPGAPRFWKWANQPFCAMTVLPFGTAGDEVQIGGSCNHSIAVFGVAPPEPLFGTACLPFAGSNCDPMSNGVFFDFSSPTPPFVDLSANVRANQAVGDRQGWEGAAAGPDVPPFFFPFDPVPDRPRFP